MAANLTPEELEELERRRKEGKPTLDEEIVRKYDADRLQRMVVSGAGRGENLDLATRSDMERRLPGADFSRVRVFRGALAEEVTARHKADAVTIGNTGMIMVRQSPRSAPGTSSGQALLAHELTHVAQAQRGMHFAKEGGGDDSPHEVEARAVESGVKGNAPKGNQFNPQKEAEKVEAKRKVIVERTIELLEEETYWGSVRRGTDWSAPPRRP